MEGIITKCIAFSISSFVTNIDHVLLGQASKIKLDPNFWSHKRPTNNGLAGKTWKNTNSTEIFCVFHFDKIKNQHGYDHQHKYNSQIQDILFFL